MTPRARGVLVLASCALLCLALWAGFRASTPRFKLLYSGLDAERAA